MRRREFITRLGVAATIWPIAARAQQSTGRRPLIGLLSPISRATAARNVDGLRKGLRDLGYVEGRNIAVEYRYSDGVPSNFPALAAQLVALNPDVILVGSSSGILATYRATQTIPLVMVVVEDPVTLGVVKSIARPGTNVTGTWMAGDEALGGKRLGMLKDIVAGVSRVAAMVNPDDASDAPLLRLLPAAAHALGLTLRFIEVREVSEFDGAFAGAARDGTQALLVGSSPFFLAHRSEVAATAARRRLPAIYGWREFVEAGGLVSYGPSLPDTYRRSAGLVGRILEGVIPADLPVEIPTRFELVINLKTAKALGLTISDQFLLPADEVIE
jgi:putative tryptophan/tyrosine transport system substrate-binding protein